MTPRFLNWLDRLIGGPLFVLLVRALRGQPLPRLLFVLLVRARQRAGLPSETMPLEKVQELARLANGGRGADLYVNNAGRPYVYRGTAVEPVPSVPLGQATPTSTSDSPSGRSTRADEAGAIVPLSSATRASTPGSPQVAPLTPDEG